MNSSICFSELMRNYPATVTTSTYILDDYIGDQPSDALFQYSAEKYIEENNLSKNVLRYLQPNKNYHLVGRLLTKPYRKKCKNEYSVVLGLVYECKKPTNGINYKQDFIAYSPEKNEFKFVFEVDKWKNHYPELISFRPSIWTYAEFNTEVAHGQHYQSSQGGHWFKEKDDLMAGVKYNWDCD